MNSEASTGKVTTSVVECREFISKRLYVSKEIREIISKLQCKFLCTLNLQFLLIQNCA